ncbi:MAG: D-alanyl-D-alanine carboxypeptidase [Geminicoccaceae bacterium]|nr:MAG: D-alanyl-D-alanine carboxypeptidase [Geminicoccaceae bacterium]
MRLIAAAVLSLVLLTPARADVPFETIAPAAILLDFPSGQVLFEKDADTPRPPASMSKLMTAFTVFEDLAAGRLSLDDTFPVSEKAWRTGGSKMFVEVGDRVRVEDLLRGIIIQSGNDACVVVAEALGGTEAAFAAAMTRRGREIGLTNSNFMNASGLPHPEHRMSVRDLGILANELIRRFPQFYHFYGERSFTFAGIEQSSRNPLLQSGIEGVDGLKTGHTREAGYGLVASAERDGRRLVLVVAGLETVGQRRREAERLLEFGFRFFQYYRLFEAGEAIDQATVWFGDRRTVPLVARETVAVTMLAENRDSLAVRVAYDGPIVAPARAGTVVGELIIDADGLSERRVPLMLGEDIGEANVFGRMWSAMRHLVGRSS